MLLKRYAVGHKGGWESEIRTPNALLTSMVKLHVVGIGNIWTATEDGWI